MSQPLYFLPNATRALLAPGHVLTRSILVDRGLGEIFADVTRDDRDCTICELSGRGPGDRSGVILCYQRPDGEIPRRLGYFPDEQAWVDCGQYWLGHDPSSPPTPEDLARKKLHPGYRLDLADGGIWQIPIIRRPDDSTELPQDLGWSAAGALEQTIKARYRAYWEASADVADWFFETGRERAAFTVARALELAVEAIGINYRFGRAEQNLLKPVDSTNWGTVLGASIDFPSVSSALASQKKNPEETPGSASSLPGAEGD